MYFISWARRNCLPSIGCFPGPRLIFLRFTSFSKAGVESSSHGTIHEAFRRVAALCIPLLRSNRHQRLLERIVPPRASGSFLSPDPRSSNPEQGSAQPAYQLLSELGGSFCQEPPHSHRVGPKRCPQRGSGPALVAPNAQEGLLWRLFHFSRAWNKGQPSGSACRSILPKTPTTGSWRISAAASRTTTSTFTIKCLDPS